MIKRIGLRCLMLALGGVTATPLAMAQGGPLVLEEVIVTAQKRTQSLQDVAISVSALTGNKLVEAGLGKIEDLSTYVPNLTMSETGIGSNIYIRGIGSGINNGFEQSVGMYVDGVYYGRAQLSRAPFLDLARVEVLRGPQAILFGKNSIAGAISLITERPTDTFEAQLRGLYEPRYGEKEGTLILSGPLSDSVRGRLAYRYHETDGYIENLTLDRDEPQREEEVLRGVLEWDVSSKLTATLKLEQGRFDVTGRQIEILDDKPADPTAPNPGAFAPRFQGQTYADIMVNSLGQHPSALNTSQDRKRSSNGDYSDNRTNNATLTLDYALGEHTLTATAAYLDYKFEELCDCDFTGANVFKVDGREDFKQQSVELRLTSPQGERFDYIAGAYWQSNELDFNEAFLVDSNSVISQLISPVVADKSVRRLFTQDSDTWSVFGKGTWHITSRWRASLGVRYSEETKDGYRRLRFQEYAGGDIPPAQKSVVALAYGLVFKAEEHELAGSRDESKLTPSVTLEWDATDDLMLYASWSRGYKSGGFDARSNVSPTPVGNVPAGSFEYDEEQAESVELGSKWVFADGAAELNLAAYRTEFDDMQVSIFDGTLGFNVGNAARAVTQGVEVDGRWRLTEGLTVLYSLAYLDFEFRDFANGQCAFRQIPDTPADPLNKRPPFCDYSGRENQYTAPWSGNVSLDYRMPLGARLELRTTVDALYSDEYYLSQNLDNAAVQEAYWKFNARLAIGDIDDRWEVALVGKNLTDKDTLTYANDTPLAVGSFSAGGHYGFVAPPRTIAISASWTWY